MLFGNKKEKQIKKEYEEISKKFHEFAKQVYDSKNLMGSDHDKVVEILEKTKVSLDKIYREKLVIFGSTEL